MGRMPRYVLPDGMTHVYARGVRQRAIYVRAADAQRFLREVDEITQRFEIKILAYVLMPNHYHFVIDALRTELSRAMHRLNGLYAQWFNKQHGHWGHLFGDRFAASTVVDERHALRLMSYIFMNPVRAGLCRHPAEWRWSSYDATVGRRPKPRHLSLDWMTDFISPSGVAQYVDEALAAHDGLRAA